MPRPTVPAFDRARSFQHLSPARIVAVLNHSLSFLVGRICHRCSIGRRHAHSQQIDGARRVDTVHKDRQRRLSDLTRRNGKSRQARQIEPQLGRIAITNVQI